MKQTHGTTFFLVNCVKFTRFSFVFISVLKKESLFPMCIIQHMNILEVDLLACFC